MKFAADAMLGKLTRWLRMSGYDVYYERSVDDDHLLDVAKGEERVLLTRDKALFRRADSGGQKALLIKGQDFTVRLKEVMDAFGVTLKKDPSSSRCPVCNHELVVARKEDVEKDVPKKVLDHMDRFWRCRSCGKLYWEGGHWEEIRRTIDGVCKKI